MSPALAHTPSGSCLELRRTLDADVFNRVANDPAVRPGLGLGVGALDFTGALRDLGNFGFANDHGGVLVTRAGPRRYEWHTLFDAGFRGRRALAAAVDVFRFMFVETDCEEIVTRVPAELPQADFMARRAGFRPLFRMAHGWTDAAGQSEPMQAFSLTLDEWRTQDPTLVAEGEAFHALLSTAAAQAGDAAPLHPHEDADHERAAGMASLMAKAGNVLKAVAAYGRWADLASYRSIQIISAAPPVIDVGNALIAVRHGRLEVLKWLRPQ